MLKNYKADLHIHTCLSPCGDLKMTPQKIIKEVLLKNIDIATLNIRRISLKMNPKIKTESGYSNLQRFFLNFL